MDRNTDGELLFLAW